MTRLDHADGEESVADAAAVSPVWSEQKHKHRRHHKEMLAQEDQQHVKLVAVITIGVEKLLGQRICGCSKERAEREKCQQCASAQGGAEADHSEQNERPDEQDAQDE